MKDLYGNVDQAYVVRMMGRRRYRWSNYDYDQSSSGSYSRNRCNSGDRQIKYRDRSRDRYNERSEDRYRYMKEVTGLELFIKMYTELDLVKCIEKMIERIMEKKLI